MSDPRGAGTKGEGGTPRRLQRRGGRAAAAKMGVGERGVNEMEETHFIAMVSWAHPRREGGRKTSGKESLLLVLFRLFSLRLRLRQAWLV